MIDREIAKFFNVPILPTHNNMPGSPLPLPNDQQNNEGSKHSGPHEAVNLWPWPVNAMSQRPSLFPPPFPPPFQPHIKDPFSTLTSTESTKSLPGRDPETP